MISVEICVLTSANVTADLLALVSGRRYLLPVVSVINGTNNKDFTKVDEGGNKKRMGTSERGHRRII